MIVSYPFVSVSEAQYRAMVSDGAHDQPSPMDGLYADVMVGAQGAGIDPRLVCAWTKSENANATEISDSLLGAKNIAGLKFVGQARAINGQPGVIAPLAPADEGSVPYCVFASWADFFYTLAANIRWVIDAQGGDLNRGAWYYTLGTPGLTRAANGEQHPKTIYYEYYRQHYPSGGTVADTGVYGEDIVAALIPHLGESASDGTLDPWNGPHPWPGYCEAATEGAQYAAGLHDIVHRGSAALKLDAVTAQGLLQTSWPPEDGGICLWGRAFDPQGHTTVWSAAKQMWISTLYPPHAGLDYFYSDAWKAAMAGWYRAPGVVAANRAAPPVDPITPQTPFFVDGNPYGPIPVRDLFWARFDALNTMGAKLGHPGAINPKGLALPMLGYPMAADTTLPTGRRIQKFERGWLAMDKGADPFDVVVLMLSEQPA